MRVLQINKFHYARGGAERYYLDLVEHLPRAGHAVAPFSMRHARNRENDYESYFVSYVDYKAEAGALGSVAMAARTVYNREARRRLGELVEAFRPDVAHLHNVHHQLSGSVIEELAERGVPMVQTLHDYQWVCPVYTFLRRGTVCERCRGHAFHHAVLGRCQDGSVARSVIAALELKVGVARGWRDRIGRFLAPSRFLGEKFVEHGFPPERVHQQNYSLHLDQYTATAERGAHALYAGRLSREKGVETLVRALARVPDLELRIAGSGPLEPDLHRLADSVAPGRVRFLGHLEGDALHRAVAGARFTVVPSEWYENQPFAVLEAFALRTPVVGARIGGIPELVEEGETGFLFESGSVDSLAATLERVLSRDDLRDIGECARRRVETGFDPGEHLAALLRHYEAVA